MPPFCRLRKSSSSPDCSVSWFSQLSLSSQSPDLPCASLTGPSYPQIQVPSWAWISFKPSLTSISASLFKLSPLLPAPLASPHLSWTPPHCVHPSQTTWSIMEAVPLTWASLVPLYGRLSSVQTRCLVFPNLYTLAPRSQFCFPLTSPVNHSHGTDSSFTFMQRCAGADSYGLARAEATFSGRLGASC